jgi:hypothetical protein
MPRNITLAKIATMKYMLSLEDPDYSIMCPIGICPGTYPM